jgi:5-oxopent-3-ene-1,2,5-tricarboxylate decarboxylase / 2-hydroxyhepta-2,4-diene-1,7-dioate isomerase
MHAALAIYMPMRPWRLSGVVYGTLLNHAPALQALGEAANAAPYKAAPQAPILFVKPRNTLLAPESPVAAPPVNSTGSDAWQVGVSLGIVIGRPACRVAEDHANDFIAGYTMVGDFSVPHQSCYRPSVRFKARDGSCKLGPRVVPAAEVANADNLSISVQIGKDAPLLFSTSQMIRPVARLIADVSEFMTLSPGDVLMLGVAHGAPLVKAGQKVRTEIQGIGSLTTQVEAV